MPTSPSPLPFPTFPLRPHRPHTSARPRSLKPTAPSPHPLPPFSLHPHCEHMSSHPRSLMPTGTSPHPFPTFPLHPHRRSTQLALARLADKREPKHRRCFWEKMRPARPETPKRGTSKLPFGAQCPDGALAEPGVQLSPVTGFRMGLYFMKEKVIESTTCACSKLNWSGKLLVRI